VFYEIKDGYVRLKIKAQPQSSKNSFCGLYGDTLKIKIKAPAVEGAANKELIKFISKSFKIPKSQVEFISGESSKIKLLKFPKSEKFLEFVDNLKE
jgi:uncharacterized protein (TIGR00251 family)